MMRDAEHGLFEQLCVKDISRLARNTVDLLQSVRTLKSYGIETQFLTANMTSMGNSEFVLTIFGALAQEESANTSKRVKFSKKINAEKGRVPNFVYGYDKTIGKAKNEAATELTYTDLTSIADWALEGVHYCTAAKYLSGSNNAFNPNGTATRAMVAQVFMNMAA